MWSLTSPLAGRASGAKKIRSPTRRDFFNSIRNERARAPQHLRPLDRYAECGRATPSKCRLFLFIDYGDRTAGLTQGKRAGWERTARDAKPFSSGWLKRLRRRGD
jgi:hypothetical protein